MKKILFAILALFVVFAFAQEESKQSECLTNYATVESDVSTCLANIPQPITSNKSRCECIDKYTKFFTDHDECVEHEDTAASYVNYIIQCNFYECEGCLSWAFHAAAPAFVAIIAIIALLF